MFRKKVTKTATDQLVLLSFAVIIAVFGLLLQLKTAAGDAK